MVLRRKAVSRFEEKPCPPSIFLHPAAAMATSKFEDEVAISQQTTDCRVITEPVAPYRIVHVNDAWCRTTGYMREQLIGKTCKVLQGPETCQRTRGVRAASSLPESCLLGVL